MEENFQNLVLLEKINYETHKWDVVGNFKLICFLLGQQGGFENTPVFCAWNVEVQIYTTPRKYGLIDMS